MTGYDLANFRAIAAPVPGPMPAMMATSLADIFAFDDGGFLINGEYFIKKGLSRLIIYLLNYVWYDVTGLHYKGRVDSSA